MNIQHLSKKGRELLKMYSQMVDEGYERVSGEQIQDVFSDFESRHFKEQILNTFREYKIKSVLDYGCGGSDWYLKGFDQKSNKSAVQYYSLDYAKRYEPSRKIDDRQLKCADCVMCFDVLEHVFVTDVPNVLRDIFKNAKKLVILNVACYPAAAKLPNGENAHITLRPPLWWKGAVDSIASEFDEITVHLGCSEKYKKVGFFAPFGKSLWEQSTTYVTKF